MMLHLYWATKQPSGWQGQSYSGPLGQLSMHATRKSMASFRTPETHDARTWKSRPLWTKRPYHPSAAVMLPFKMHWMASAHGLTPWTACLQGKPFSLLKDRYCLSTANVKRTQLIVNPWKTVSPDKILDCIVKECVNQLANVFKTFLTFLWGTPFSPYVSRPPPSYSCWRSLLSPATANCSTNTYHHEVLQKANHGAPA